MRSTLPQLFGPMHSDFHGSTHSIGVEFENVKSGKRKLEDTIGHHLAEVAEIRPSITHLVRVLMYS